MGKMISLVNQKGGVGKTTTSINLSASLAYLGKKVLLLDLDPQGNTTTGIGMNKGDIDKTIYDVLIGKCDIKEAIIHTKYKRLDLLPATVNLSGLDTEFFERSKEEPNFVKGAQLKNKIDLVRDEYDFIIVDCPPSLSIITINALTASNSVIIPVQCEFLALEGIMQLLNTIMMAQKQLNPDLDIEGVLLTMLDGRTNIGLEVIEEIRKVKNDCYSIDIDMYNCYYGDNALMYVTFDLVSAQVLGDNYLDKAYEFIRNMLLEPDFTNEKSY